MASAWKFRGLFPPKTALHCEPVSQLLSSLQDERAPPRRKFPFSIESTPPVSRPSSPPLVSKSLMEEPSATGESKPPLTNGRPNVAVLASTNLQLDAESIMYLVPNTFDQDQSLESCFLTEKFGGFSIMLVDCNTHGSVPIHWGNAILVLEDAEILLATKRCHDRSISIVFDEELEVSKDAFSRLVVARLSGGGNLVMLSSALLASSFGRKTLANAFLSNDFTRIVDEIRSSMKLPPLEDEILRDLEAEYSSNVDCESDSLAHTRGNTLPKFPSLELSLERRKGTMQHGIPINSRGAISVETDLFIGKLSLIMRPLDPKDDPYYNDMIFSKSRTTFIFQLQGKFRYVPQGTVYAGAEISNTMNVGLMTKALCGLLLKSIRKNHPQMHFSYGEKKSGERPHISMPAWTFFDRITVTKSPDVPPPLHLPFPESVNSINARKASGMTGKWNTHDTYSMSFFSTYLDFPSWQLSNLDLIEDVDLHQFWGDSHLRLVLYEKKEYMESALHLQMYNNYMFVLQMKFLQAEPDSEDSEEVVSNREHTLPWGKTRESARFKDTVMDRADEGNEEGTDELEIVDIDPSEAQSTERIEVLPSKGILEKADLFCPGWIEMVAPEGRAYIKMFAFNVTKGTKTVFRTAAEFYLYFDTHDTRKDVEAMSSPRLSASEKTRRVLGYSLAQQSGNKLRQFTSLKGEFDTTFLQRSEQQAPATRIGKTALKSGYMARALSDRHWREEFVRLLDDSISFFHPERSKPSFRIHLHTVVNMKRMSDDECPALPKYSFLSIETLGRTIYLMFASEADRDSWADAIGGLTVGSRINSEESIPEYTPGSDVDEPVSANGGQHQTESQTSDTKHLFGIDDPTEEFLHNSSIWDCKQRRILNCRRFSLRTAPEPHDPCELVEDALRLLYEVQETSNEYSLLGFLDATALLKDVDVYGLQEKNRVAFFLNLYHLMIMHACLLMGPPVSSFQFLNMIQMVSYQVSDDVFCLAELEHCIIRAAMTFPSQFTSKFILPKSQYSFALTQSDFRINFALNCGSRSNPDSVPIYKAVILDMQLETVTLLFLESVQVAAKQNQSGGVLVTLPRVCQWFSDDFGSGSAMDVVMRIKGYLDDDRQQLLEGSERPSPLTIKYLPFSFECRKLRLENARKRRTMSFD